jgi:hypothetical protein
VIGTPKSSSTPRLSFLFHILALLTPQKNQEIEELSGGKKKKENLYEWLDFANHKLHYMSSYRHHNSGPQGHYFDHQQQQYHQRQPQQQVRGRGHSQQDIPLLLSPNLAIGILLALFVVPLILLLASQFGGYREYLGSKGGMFRNIGLGLAYPKWKDGHGQSNGKDRGEQEDDSGSASGSDDAKRKTRRHRRTEPGKDRERKKTNKSVVVNGESGGNVYYPGLVNISGTYCFLNSVVQALASLGHLKPYLDDVQEKAEDLDVPTPVIDALRDAMIGKRAYHFWRPPNTDFYFLALNTPRKKPTTLKPLPLIEALSSPPPINPSSHPPSSSRTSALFASREHQDAQELFVLLSERVKEEASAVERELKQSKVGLRGFDSRTLQKARMGGSENGRTKNPFDGLTANRRSCVQCGYTEAVMHFHFSCWSLSLPRAVSVFPIVPFRVWLF